MRRHAGLTLGLTCLLLALLPVAVGTIWLPHDPNALGGEPYAPPSLRHLMGTDWFGRDLLSRVMVGGRASLGVAVLAVVVGGLVGTALGTLAGSLGRVADEALMRLTDALLAFPALLVALLLRALWGPGLPGVALALALFNVPFFARLSRAGLLALRDREFVLAARASGAGGGWILRHHILPHLASPLLVQATVALGAALLAEAALSYLGLGLQPPDPAWGRMLREAQASFELSPWPAVFPGAVLALAVLGLNLVGDGLRDLLDPSFRRLTRPRPP